MSLSDQFKTNPVIENEGVEVTYAPNADGSVPTFIVARAGKSNKAYQSSLIAAFKPYERAQKLGTLKAELADSIYRDVFIKTVVKGWRNIPMRDVTGNKKDEGFADFNFDNAKNLFINLPELYEDLTDKAMQASMFREESLEEEVKN